MPPLVVAFQCRNDFEVAKIVRKNSPLFNKEAFKSELSDQTKMFEKSENAVEALMRLWDDEKTPSCLEVLNPSEKQDYIRLGTALMRC